LLIRQLTNLITPEADGTTPLSKYLAKAYNPDQPRDERGRFGSGGGSTQPANDGSSHGLKEGDTGAGVSQKNFAGEHLVNDGEHSLADHLVADGRGGWKLDSATQQRLNDRIATVTGGVPRSNNPTFTMLGGGPAAGKSTVTNDPKSGVPNTDPSKGEVKAVLINADEEKAANPNYLKMVNEGNPKAAGYAHEESSYFAKQIQAAAIANHQDVVLDGTGNSKVESVLGKINGARAAGYAVNGVYVTCPTEVALSRANARAADPNSGNYGRTVPEGVIRGTHAAVSSIVPSVASSFDTFKLVDTTPGAPSAGQTIAQTTRGQDMTVNDKSAYATFLNKANEGK
jgi:predicted ABC-type ATPase